MALFKFIFAAMIKLYARLLFLVSQFFFKLNKFTSLVTLFSNKKGQCSKFNEHFHSFIPVLVLSFQKSVVIFCLSKLSSRLLLCFICLLYLINNKYINIVYVYFVNLFIYSFINITKAIHNNE